MSYPVNFLQQVQTYQPSGLALLQNLYCGIANTNSLFNNFQDRKANLGSTVTYDSPPRFTTTNSLVAQWQSANQQVHSLTVDNPISTSFTFTAEQMLFNIDPMDYMKNFGRSAVAEIGSKIEENILQNFLTNTFRFYGTPSSPPNSFDELADALAFFAEFGSADGKRKGFLNNLSVPKIIQSGLREFAPDRNNRIAESWEVGSFDNTDFFRSSLLPLQTAGTEGNAGSTLTVVSTTTNALGQVTAITFSGTSAASDTSSVMQNDSFQFLDNVTGYTNMRYRQYIGHNVSGCPVQFKATANAASTSGSEVTVNIFPFLQAAQGSEQNINTTIVAGMQCQVLATHRGGALMSGNPFYMAMPSLPDNVPYPTGYMPDPDTGVSMRQTFGTVFGQNQQGMIYDAIWGSDLTPQYAMKLVFPQ